MATKTTKSTPTPTPAASAPLTSQLGLGLAQSQTNAQNNQSNAPVAGTGLSTGYTPVTVAPTTNKPVLEYSFDAYDTSKNPPKPVIDLGGGPAYYSADGIRTQSDGKTPYSGVENISYGDGTTRSYNIVNGKTVSVTENGVTKPYTGAVPTTKKEYTPTSGSLNYFIQQAGGDRARGLEMYKKAQDEKPKAIITPLSDRQKEEDALNSGSGSAPTNTGVKPGSVTQKNTTPTTTPPGSTPTTTPPVTTPTTPPVTDKKTTPPPAVPYTDKKTVAYWTSQGQDYKTAVANAKAERAKAAEEKKQNTTLDMRDNKGTTEVNSFLDTKEVISNIGKANITDEEKNKLTDEFNGFEARSKELQREIDEQNTYTTQRIAELDKSGNEFESNRLNQVRSAILQKLAARGINIADIPADQLLALSGEAGVAAFKDVYDKKEEIKQKISTLEKEKMTSLNDLRSRKVLNEAQYKSAITTIKASADAERNKIDENFNTTAYNALFANKQNDISQGNTLTSNINSLLTQYGVSAQFAGDFQSVLGAKSVAEAQQKIFDIFKNNPDLAKKIDEARKATSASATTSAANLGLNISKEEFDRKQALYNTQEKIIDDQYKNQNPSIIAQKKSELYNSIFGTSSGGASTSASPWL